MTPCQKIKRDILLIVQGLGPQTEASARELALIKSLDAGITAETVDNQYNELVELKLHWDYEYEFREGQVETKLPCDYSRHYEAKAVARKMSDDTWVGWVYWYGGGKHGNPEGVPWMEDAYDLELTETEKLVVVQEFKRKLSAEDCR